MRFDREGLPQQLLMYALAALCAAGTVHADDPALEWYQRDSSSPWTQDEWRARLLEIRGDQAQHKSYETIVAIFIDRKHVAELLGRVTDEGTPPLFRYREIRSLLSSCLDEESLIALAEFQDYQGWVALDHLESYEPRFDQDNLVLFLTTPAFAREEKIINIIPILHPDLSKALEPADFSAYVNTFHQATYDDHHAYYRLDLEGAVRWEPWVLEGDAWLDGRQARAIDYKNLRLIRDWPDCPSRLIIGETRSLIPRILASDSIQGIRYGTEFDLQPYTITEPVSEYTFILERESNVEIWVNGRPFRTLRLKPGPYDMRHFPLSLGFNNIELRITDTLGRFQVLTFNAIRGPNLLAPGRCEYSCSAGVIGSGSSYGQGWVVGANYRNGLTDTLTLATESRADADQQSIGMGADFATSWCFGRLDAGLAHTCHGVGGTLQALISRYIHSVSVSYRFNYFQRRFLFQRQLYDAERIRSTHEFSVIAPSLCGTGSWRFSAARQSRWHGRSEYRQELSWAYTFNDRWSFRAVGSHTNIHADEWSALGQITYHFHKEDYRRHHDAQFGTDGYRLYSSLGKNPPDDPFSWQLFHTHTRREENDSIDTIRANAFYDHWRYHLHYSGEIGDFADENNQRHQINFNTALAYVCGEWGISEPILDSFAIAAPDDRLSGVGLAGYCSGFGCRCVAGSSLVIPNLLSYYPAYVRIDTDDDTIFLDREPYMLLPKYKSGFLIRVSNDEGEGGLLSASGMLYDNEGAPLALQALTLHNVSNPDAEAFLTFTNDVGSFRIGGLMAGTSYRVTVGFDGVAHPDEPIYEFTLPYDAGFADELSLGDIMPLHALVKAPTIRVAAPMPAFDLAPVWKEVLSVAPSHARPLCAPLRPSAQIGAGSSSEQDRAAALAKA